MVADLREMQENQWVSENRIDKLEFVDQLKGALLYTCCVYCAVCDFAPHQSLPLHKGTLGTPAPVHYTTNPTCDSQVGLTVLRTPGKCPAHCCSFPVLLCFLGF